FLNADTVLGDDSRLSFVHGFHCRLLSRSWQPAMTAVELQPVSGMTAAELQPVSGMTAAGPKSVVGNAAETTNAQRSGMSIEVLQSRTSRVWSSSFANS